MGKCWVISLQLSTCEDNLKFLWLRYCYLPILQFAVVFIRSQKVDKAHPIEISKFSTAYDYRIDHGMKKCLPCDCRLKTRCQPRIGSTSVNNIRKLVWPYLCYQIWRKIATLAHLSQSLGNFRYVLISIWQAFYQLWQFLCYWANFYCC